MSSPRYFELKSVQGLGFTDGSWFRNTPFPRDDQKTAWRTALRYIIPITSIQPQGVTPIVVVSIFFAIIPMQSLRGSEARGFLEIIQGKTQFREEKVRSNLWGVSPWVPIGGASGFRV